MADIIKFATGQELQKILEASNQMVAGMSPEEARAALKLVESGKMMTGSAKTGGANNVIQFPGTNASGAFNDYVSGGGTISPSNSATAPSISSATIAQGATGVGTTVLGVLTMNLPTVAAAIAPVLGVGLGVGLYEANPELWTKISQTLLPFCWEGTDVIPAVVDKDGQVYLDGNIFDSLKDLFEKEDVYSSSGKIDGEATLPDGTTANVSLNTLDVNIFEANSATSTVTSNIVAQDSTGNFVGYFEAAKKLSLRIAFIYNPNPNIDRIGYILCVFTNKYDSHTSYRLWDKSTETNATSSSIIDYPIYTPNNSNKSVLYGYAMFNTWDSIPLTPSIPYSDLGGLTWNKAAWIMQYGDLHEELTQTGLSKWTGNVPSDYTQNSINVIKNSAGESTVYYPVTLPVGDPGISNNPSVNPNPQAPTEFPQLEPYIPTIVSPSTYPLEIPVPDETARTSPIESYVPNLSVNLNPNTDPSAEPAPAPEPVPDPYPDLKPPSSVGNSPSVVFPLPGDFPSIVPVSGSGLIHVYNPTPQEMISFGNWLWVTYADASIQKIWNNPFDGVISAHELYATPSNDGRDNIRSGFLVCPTSAALVRQRYATIDCGSMVVPEYYGNYLDYAPYSKAHVYLPFIGIVELDVDDIVGHGVNITYHIDSYNGSCIAQITVAKTDYQNTVYQFSGNCSVEIPLAGGSQAAIKAGLISAAATGISSIVGGLASMFSGNIAGGIGGIAYGIGGAVSQAVSQKSSVQHSGTFGASYGAMGIKKPYFIIHRPIQKIVVNYNEDYGFPAHKRVRIGNCKGFLRVREVHAVSSTATDEEKARIEELLKDGVFVS